MCSVACGPKTVRYKEKDARVCGAFVCLRIGNDILVRKTDAQYRMRTKNGAM